MTDHPAYLPTQHVTDLEDALNRDRESDDPIGMWPLERLLERVFADGYRQGHLRGYAAGRAVVRRRVDNEGKSDEAAS